MQRKPGSEDSQVYASCTLKTVRLTDPHLAGSLDKTHPSEIASSFPPLPIITAFNLRASTAY
jgi:hypothetical protein